MNAHDDSVSCWDWAQSEVDRPYIILQQDAECSLGSAGQMGQRPASGLGNAPGRNQAATSSALAASAPQVLLSSFMSVQRGLQINIMPAMHLHVLAQNYLATLQSH